MKHLVETTELMKKVKKLVLNIRSNKQFIVKQLFDETANCNLQIFITVDCKYSINKPTCYKQLAAGTADYTIYTAGTVDC